MQDFAVQEIAEIDPAATEHVALLDGDGTVIYHEELTPDRASLRHLMFMLQAEADSEGRNQDLNYEKHARKVYRGTAWPPEGHEEKKVGKAVQVVALPAEGA